MDTKYNNLVREYNKLLRCYDIMREVVCSECHTQAESCDQCHLYNACKDFDPMEEEK